MAQDNFTASFDGSDEAFVSAEPSYENGIRTGSALEILANAVKSQVEIETLEYIIPNRPVIKLIIDPNMDGEMFQRWQRNCVIGKNRSGQGGQTDTLKLTAIVVANQTVGVKVRDGEEWTEAFDEQGERVTFRSPWFRNLLSNGKPVHSATHLVRELFAGDGHVIDCGIDVIEAAGYLSDDLRDRDENPMMR